MNYLHPLDEIEKTSYLNRLLFFVIVKLVPIFYYLNLTPNLVTTISLYFCYYSYYYLTKNLSLHLIYYWCYVILDYCDGFMARKYNMVTKFGDFFDHFRDDVFHFFLFKEIIVLNYNSNPNQEFIFDKFSLKLLTIILYIIYYCIKTVVTFGYQEHKIYSLYIKLNRLEEYNKERKSVMWSKNWAPKYNYFLELYYKYIGTSGMFIDVSLLMVYHYLTDLKK